MHDGMPYGRNQGQGQGHSREVDRQSPMGLIFIIIIIITLCAKLSGAVYCNRSCLWMCVCVWVGLLPQ